MSKNECIHEVEVVEAVSCGRWPEQCGEELRSHVSACEICTEVVEVSLAMHEAYDEAAQAAHVPSAGLVWWRAELRARRDAVRTAERPIKVVHAFAGACGIGIVAAFLTQLSPLFRGALTRLTGIHISDLSGALLQQNLPITLTFGVLLILAPIALYLVFSDK